MTDADYFRPLGFGTTFGRVFQVFGDRWKAFLAISFVWYALGWIFAILLNLVMGNDITIDGFSSAFSSGTIMTLEVDESGSSSENDLVMASADARIFYLIEVFIYYVFTAVAHGAAIWIIAHWYLHQEPSLLVAFGVATDKCWTLIGATLLLAVLTLLVALPVMVIAFVSNDEAVIYVLIFLVAVGMCIFSILTYVTYVAVMVEGKGSWDSIKRSFGLTKGNIGKIFCIVFLWGIVKFVLGAIITMVLFYGVGYGDSHLLYFGKFLDTVVGIFLLAIAPV